MGRKRHVVHTTPRKTDSSQAKKPTSRSRRKSENGSGTDYISCARTCGILVLICGICGFLFYPDIVGALKMVQEFEPYGTDDSSKPEASKNANSLHSRDETNIFDEEKPLSSKREGDLMENELSDDISLSLNDKSIKDMDVGEGNSKSLHVDKRINREAAHARDMPKKDVESGKRKSGESSEGKPKSKSSKHANRGETQPRSAGSASDVPKDKPKHKKPVQQNNENKGSAPKKSKTQSGDSLDNADKRKDNMKIKRPEEDTSQKLSEEPKSRDGKRKPIILRPGMGEIKIDLEQINMGESVQFHQEPIDEAKISKDAPKEKRFIKRTQASPKEKKENGQHVNAQQGIQKDKKEQSEHNVKRKSSKSGENTDKVHKAKSDAASGDKTHGRKEIREKTREQPKDKDIKAKIKGVKLSADQTVTSRNAERKPIILNAENSRITIDPSDIKYESRPDVKDEPKTTSKKCKDTHKTTQQESKNKNKNIKKTVSPQSSGKSGTGSKSNEKQINKKDGGHSGEKNLNANGNNQKIKQRSVDQPSIKIKKPPGSGNAIGGKDTNKKTATAKQEGTNKAPPSNAGKAKTEKHASKNTNKPTKKKEIHTDESKEFEAVYQKTFTTKKIFEGGRRIPPSELLPQKKTNSSVRVFLFDEFLSDQECDGLMKAHDNHVKMMSKAPLLCFDSVSTLRRHLKDVGKKIKVTPNVFTSDTKCLNASFSMEIQELMKSNWSYSTAFYPGESSFSKAAAVRIHRAMGLNPENGGKFQITSYPPGKAYKTHTDCTLDGTDERDRVVSVLMYLNTAEDGGETRFPDLGIWVKPRKGRAIVWNNMSPAGFCEPHSGHVASVVKTGSKYVLIRWYYYKNFYSIGKRHHPPEFPPRDESVPMVMCDEYNMGSCRWYDEWSYDALLSYNSQEGIRV